MKPLRRLLPLIFLLAALLPLSAGAATHFSVVDSVLIIPAGVKCIPDFAFADRRDFREVRFISPESIAEIGDYAFLGCKNLKKINLPASLRKVGEGVFRECASLQSIAIPVGVAKIPKYCFAWCNSLRDVILPESIDDIASHSFAYCASIEDFHFPSALKHIGSNAFSFCSSLKSAALPASITELESYAFAECINLEKASLPANPSLLGELVFSGCRSLREITELSPIPPKFDCDSEPFDPITESTLYRQCVLTVPDKAGKYSSTHPWSKFSHITPPL